MKFLLSLLVVIMIVPAKGQIINNVIVDNSAVYGSSLHGGDRPFKSKIEILSPPAPLKVGEASYTLEVINDDLPIMKKDWVLTIGYNAFIMDILGDINIPWPGPHKAGDILSGKVDFMPLVSGPGGITIYVDSVGGKDLPNAPASGASFKWYLDEDGKLQYLCSDKEVVNKPINVKVNYFKDAPIIFKQYGEPHESDIFAYSVIINPMPRANDTIIVDYKLKALKTLPVGCDLRFDVYCMDIISYPKWDGLNIIEGQEYDLPLAFKPKNIAGGQSIGLHFIENYGGADRLKLTQVIPCSFIFNEDGTLKYISQFSSMNIPSNKIPKSPGKCDTKYDRHVVTLKANGKIEELKNLRKL